MRKFMILLLFLTISITLKTTDVTALMDGTISDDGNGGGSSQWDDFKDPLGEKSIANYTGPYNISLVDFTDYTMPFQVSGNNIFVQKQRYQSEESDYCSLLGPDWFEYERDLSGIQRGTRDLPAISSNTYTPAGYDMHYTRWSGDEFKAFEIYSKCRQYHVVQRYDTFDTNNIYIWTSSTPGKSDLKRIVYLPIKELVRGTQKSYYELDNQQKNFIQTYGISGAGFLTLSTGGLLQGLGATAAASAAGSLGAALTVFGLVDIHSQSLYNSDITEIDDLLNIDVDDPSPEHVGFLSKVIIMESYTITANGDHEYDFFDSSIPTTISLYDKTDMSGDYSKTLGYYTILPANRDNGLYVVQNFLVGGLVDEFKNYFSN